MLLEATKITAIAIVVAASLIVCDEKENEGENVLKMLGKRGFFTISLLFYTIIKGYRFILVML